MAMKMDVWQWGDVKGVDEELCNNLALFAEDNKIDCMNMTEKEFVDLKNEYLMKNYENKGGFSKKSLKESKKFQYGDEIIKFLEKYGYNKRGEDFEQEKDYATVTYMYAIPKGMRPQTPYVEFTVDADNDAFIFGEYFTDGRKGYSAEFDSVEDLEYFVSNANYSNVDLTESKKSAKSLKESSNTDRMLELTWDGLITKGEYDVRQRLSLADFEGEISDDMFYIKPSAFKTFPKKRPSTNTWNCKGLVKWHDNTWKDIIISCELPQDYVLDKLGITFDNIKSYMLLVGYVVLEY